VKINGKQTVDKANLSDFDFTLTKCAHRESNPWNENRCFW